MLIHRSLFGTSVDFRVPPKRFLVIGVIALIFSVAVFIFTPRPNAPQTILDIQENAKKASEVLTKPNLSKLYNPFGSAVHAPLDQADSKLGGTRWYTHLQWLNPFSSRITLDADRALLPPLTQRTHIYAYYEPEDPDDADLVALENKILLLWRRAWWAEGFKPLVLGPAEAKKHPDYAKLDHYHLFKPMRFDLQRWLAWSHVGKGCLVDWLAFPMAGLDSLLLSDMRDPNWIMLRKYQSDKNYFLCGAEEHVNNAIHEAFFARSLDRLFRVIDLLRESSYQTMRDNTIAFYDNDTLKDKFSAMLEQLPTNRLLEKTRLHQLINAHLHTQWQSRFDGGLALLEPFTDEMSTIYSSASDLAQRLAFCPKSPLPGSCPSNLPGCKVCKSSSKLRIKTPETFDNKSKVFSVGTVPHPYTFTSLYYSRDELTFGFLRREADRDVWIKGITKSLLGSKINGPQRLVAFKDCVANQHGSLRSIWMTAEGEEEVEPEWLLGFELPSIDDVRAQTDKTKNTKEVAVGEDVKQHTEQALLQMAKTEGKKKDSRIIKAAEAWHMADWEAWRFVRALAMQRTLERRSWESMEKSFAGSESRKSG